MTEWQEFTMESAWHSTWHVVGGHYCSSQRKMHNWPSVCLGPQIEVPLSAASNGHHVSGVTRG